MNWKITRPDMWITFGYQEPIAMVSPLCRGELEGFTPEIRPISSNPDLRAANKQWQCSRDEFNQKFKDPDSEEAKAGWGKTYLRGGNQTRLHLKPFTARG